MADGLEILRQDALLKRIKGMAGGLHIAWSAKDIARIGDHIMGTSEEIILRDVRAASHKRVDVDTAMTRHKISELGLILRAAQANDHRFLFVISSETADLACDVVTVAGIDCSDFLKNPAVLNSHDSSAMPIAISTSPVVSGKALTAIAEFPEPGISECADQTAAAVRAKLVKGASIGFIPRKWSFTKDPSRPFGIDFLETKLLEWSVCSVPCNPGCLMIGAVAESKSSKTEERRREAHALAARARSIAASIGDDVAPLTRDQRLAQARNFKRVVMALEK